MTRTSEVRLTPISELLKERADVFIKLYEMRDEKEFYDTLLMNMMNVMDKDESAIGIDSCFLIPYILFRENFTLAHISYFDENYASLKDTLIKYVVKKHFSFINSYHVKHLLEYLFPYASNIIYKKNGNIITYRITIGEVNKYLLEYSKIFLETVLEELNLGKIDEYNKSIIDVSINSQDLIDFSKHNHHAVRVDKKIIDKRNELLVKFNLKSAKADKILTDLTLYQGLNILDILLKNGNLSYDIISKIYDIYSLFLELRKSGHIIVPRTKNYPSINYKSITDTNMIKQNLNIFISIINPNLKIFTLNNREIIIYGINFVENSATTDLIKYIFNNDLEIESGNNFIKIKTFNNIF